jgi:hypothetical protein
MSTLVDAIILYIRTDWAQHGLEVRSHGKRTVTVSLPPDVEDLSVLCVDLLERFDARTSISTVAGERGTSLTVWLPRTWPGHAHELVPPSSSLVLIGQWVAPCVAAAMAVAVVVCTDAHHHNIFDGLHNTTLFGSFGGA